MQTNTQDSYFANLPKNQKEAAQNKNRKLTQEEIQEMREREMMDKMGPEPHSA